MTDHLNPSQLRLLASILSLHKQGKCVSFRRVCREAGLSDNIGGYHTRQFLVLKEAGLITWEDGEYGTMRPTCTLQIIERKH